jgi:ATP-dependent helicase/nuclease subunit B
MARPFLKLVAEHIHRHYKDKAENLCIVLPGKRGALFLKQYLGQTFGKTIWLPTIISAEDLITELSGLKTLEELDLMCHLYESYRECYGENAEPFESFAKWGQLILQDFNEIDRYLADPGQLYENLKEIKVIENWSLGAEELSEFQQKYLRFMNSLGAIYKHFSKFLLERGWAYQGLAYRQAVARLSSGNYGERFHKILFCGFNALNAAELKIFRHFREKNKAEILWDADEYYLHNEQHEAGLFLRKNLELFRQKDPLFIGKHFLEEKKIEIISVPKQIGQAQVVKQCIQKYIDLKIPLDTVAVVLANEKLLWPVLQQLPEGVESVNITMEYPLRYTSTYALMDAILQIQINYLKQNRKQKHLYYKDLIALLKQPLFNTFLRANNVQTNIHGVISGITAKNISFISRKHLVEWFGEEAKLVLPFLGESAGAGSLCSDLLFCIQSLQDYFTEHSASNQVSLELEYLDIFRRNLNRLSDVLKKYPHFHDLRSFRQLFSQVVGNSTAPFIGEPLRGLQIMGVLETRTLDFEHLIIINVNESVLPAGKSVNSFIPNDLKRAFDMPLYLEKDAIYSYHFYRLLQRAGDITITYDSETDTFGKGEKSRFVTQLQLELGKYSPLVRISESVAGSSSIPPVLKNHVSVEKNDASMLSILKKATENDKYSGFSPTAVSTYKECGLKFYFRYGAGIKEIKEVEESAEANTFGSILHLSLENLYRDFTGKALTAAQLQTRLKQADTVVKKAFATFFDDGELSGKNILQFEVIKVYVEKLLKNDIRWLEELERQNRSLSLCDLEKEFGAEIKILIDNVPATVYVKGKVDRIDSDGMFYRVIDYKNSVLAGDKFTFNGFDALFEDTAYNKQLQLIMYAWLLHKNNYCEPEKMLPGIIPFREFLEEPRYIHSGKQRLQLTGEFLDEFETHLKNFLERIFDRKNNFEQTGDVEICKFCDYNLICNKHNT